MSLSLYQISIPLFLRQLNTLSYLLKKGVKTHGQTSEQQQVLLDSRLIADMQALPYQIQRVSDSVKGVAVRLGGAEPESWADDETTFEQLQERIAKTIAFIEKLEPTCMDGKEGVVVEFASYKFPAKEYILNFALPNFFFHFTMAYALLRKEGVPVGKKDYLGAGEPL
ncbi:hypothetical protein BJ875DRAFT_453134 [Amylocarpus encephaloides]|uniref:DUF1993 domain-containing protein n=1 Tax=Amylocarpus encephaloides TaxID=45428 RepID=A0A9P8C8S1_9HELO|nr:hypothetical protein BJ875DRAFT_453134 [Amylocarpus encephaloides]